MDDPAIDRTELAHALRALARTNRLLGATRRVVNLFRRWSRSWPRDQTIRVLDVGTGSADIPLALDSWAERAGFDIRITGVDLHPKTIEIARENVGDRISIELIKTDARDLLDHFQTGDFDYAHAGLFLHHLEDIDVLTVLRIMDRLTMRAVVWNDLIRSPLTKIAIRPLALMSPPIFRHDAIASINAAFTRREAIDLARRAGLANLRYRSHLFHRFLLTSEKNLQH